MTYSTLRRRSRPKAVAGRSVISRRATAAAAVFAAAAVALSGCSGESEAGTGTENGDPAVNAQNPSVAQPAGPRPTIEPREGEPPAELRITDIVEGPGPAAKAGDMVRVHYVGALWPDGTEFDASWDRNQPFEFTLGVGQVIQGWDEGVAGTRVGGRRELVIPPDLAYGDQGTGSIPGGSTLIFVVDLIGLLPAPESVEE